MQTKRAKHMVSLQALVLDLTLWCKIDKNMIAAWLAEHMIGILLVICNLLIYCQYTAISSSQLLSF